MVETIADRLTDAWARTDRIFEILAPGSWLAQPIALRHPFIFYLGHLPAFAWNHVSGGVLERPAFNAAFDELFSRGIDPDVDDPTQCHDHPEVPGPLARGGRGRRLSRSRARGAARVRGRGGGARGHAPDGPRGPRLQHGDRARAHASGDSAVHAAAAAPRAQDATGLAAALRARARPPRRPRRDPGGPGHPRPPASTSCPSAGTTSSPSCQTSTCPPSRVDATAVTNGQFQAFVEDGGYQRADLWTDEDWVWRGHDAVEHPAVWERVDGAVCRTLFDRLPARPGWRTGRST